MGRDYNSNFIGKLIKILNISTKVSYTLMQHKNQPQGASLTAFQNLLQGLIETAE